MTVDPAALARHLAAMPGPRRRPADLAAIDRALTYLRATFESFGWAVDAQVCRDPYLGEGVNLVARREGTTPGELVVVGAHHDTVPGSPGADDNTSGLAALCELARVLGTRRSGATIELVAFDFEESSNPDDLSVNFSGSRAYVASLAGRRLRAAIVYDLIAFASDAPESQRLPPGLDLLYPREVQVLEARGRRADFLAAIGYGDARGAAFLRSGSEVVERGVPELPLLAIAAPPGLPVPDLYRSDHAIFWQAGLPAIFLTDTANFRNANYHQPTDTPETLDARFWARVVDATAAIVERVAA